MSHLNLRHKFEYDTYVVRVHAEMALEQGQLCVRCMAVYFGTGLQSRRRRSSAGSSSGITK